MKKKNLFLGLLVLGAMVFLVGCHVEVSHVTGLEGLSSVRGTSDVVSRDFDVTDFTALNISGNYEVIWHQATDFSLTIEMQENLFEYVEVNVNRNTLEIRSTRSFNTTKRNRPRIYIEAPSLDAVSFSGAITTNNWDSITGQSFSFESAGAVNITFDLQVESFEVSASGAGDFTFSGNSETVDITIAGASAISASDLQTRDTSISIAGAGNVDIAVTDDLTVNITGAGRVNYIGSPAIVSTILGPGRVQQQ